MTPNLILKKYAWVTPYRGFESVAAKPVYIGPVKCAINVNMHVKILLQKEELLSATTIRNLQQPADFLQGLNRGW